MGDTHKTNIEYVCLQFEQEIEPRVFSDPEISGGEDPAQILITPTNGICDGYGGILRNNFNITYNGSQDSLKFLSRTFQVKESIVQTDIDMIKRKITTSITFMPEHWNTDLIDDFRTIYQQDGIQTILKNRCYTRPIPPLPGMEKDDD
jgi:hypothetical protein